MVAMDASAVGVQERSRDAMQAAKAHACATAVLCSAIARTAAEVEICDGGPSIHQVDTMPQMLAYLYLTTEGKNLQATATFVLVRCKKLGTKLGLSDAQISETPYYLHASWDPLAHHKS